MLPITTGHSPSHRPAASPHIRCVVAPGKSREGCCARCLIGAAPTGRCDGPSAWLGRCECFEGRAGRPVPAMTLSDVPHKPRPRAFAPPGHGLAIFPRSLSLACLAVLRPRVPLPRYFVAAAHQSTPVPWCRGGVGHVALLEISRAHIGKPY